MGRALGPVLQVAGFLTGQPWLVALGSGINTYQQIAAQRKARRAARDAYNASLTDRLEMIDLAPNAPRTLLLGRVRYVEGVRRRWTSGDHQEKLTMVVSFAGHEIDAFEQWYVHDALVELDADGWVTTAPYFKGEPKSEFWGWTPSASTEVVTLPHAPLPGSLSATWATTKSQEAGEAGVELIGSNQVRVSGLLPGVGVLLAYQHQVGKSTLRIRPYRGTATQNVGADLAAEYPGKITATDRFAGIALAVVDVAYDPDIYSQGRPTITAVMRGARLYNPRKDSTVPGGAGPHRLADPSTWEWSSNPAECAHHYARWRSGFGLPADEMLPDDVLTSAPVCDQPITIAVNGVDHTMPRYSCHLAITEDAAPPEAMADILDTMAGRAGWSGGHWRFRAGHVQAPAFTLDTSWLMLPLDAQGQLPDEPALVGANGIAPDDRINRVTGSCFDASQRYQLLPFPEVADPVLIARHGDFPLEVTMAGTADPVAARHLASIMIRQGQAGLRLRARCGLQAYGCQLFDVGQLDLPRYGMPASFGKTVEVLGWSWHPTQGITLQLAEIAPAMFSPVAALTGEDPAPNGTLPAPGEVETLAITTISSGTDALTDGSVITRTQVEWSAATSIGVLMGGQIEVQYTELSGALPLADWPSWIEAGAAVRATIPGLLAGRWYLFRVRALKPALGVRGPWSFQRAHLVAEPPAAGGGGAPGDSVELQYSVDGLGGWHSIWSSGDAFMRQRVGSGPWSGAMRILGLPGADGAPGPVATPNLLRGAQLGPLVAGPGQYGANITPLKNGEANPLGLVPGEPLTISADIWQDAVSASAGQVARIYLFSARADGAWTRSAQFGTASQAPFRGHDTVVLPPDSFDMAVVGVGVYHQDGVTNVDGTVTADRIQVQRGTVATAYMPGVQDGAQGPQGPQGSPGPAGADGATPYFHVAYASSADGSLGFNQISGPYIGTYVDFSPADSTNPAAYTWRQFVGAQGPQGTQGIPGVDGATGLTSYLHLKYSDDGGASFTASAGETPGKWIGQYVDFTEADSTNPAAYTWTLVKGVDAVVYTVTFSDAAGVSYSNMG